MLFCTIGNDPGHKFDREYTWHVGETVKWQTPENAVDLRNDTVEIQADGDELLTVCQQFPNLPVAPYRRIVIWTGEFARFIALNLAP